MIIPTSNVQHLMLRHDVVEASEAGQFHIYPVQSVDQAITILTGLPAGERDDEENFAEGSINYLVEARLIELAETQRAFGSPSENAEAGKKAEDTGESGEEE